MKSSVYIDTSVFSALLDDRAPERRLLTDLFWRTRSRFELATSEVAREELGRTGLTPIGAMAVTFDGRVFGTCGDGVSRLFTYEAGTDGVRDLGIAVSLLERRRYGYLFGAATVGRDGEIVFGEDDDLGHVWLYFPKVIPR